MDRLAEILKQLDAYFADKPRVVAAYVFGSAAGDRQRSGSDFDLAVLLRGNPGKKERADVIDHLFVEVSNLLRQDIHLLTLNDSPLTVRMQVLSRGVLAHVKDRTGLAEFRMTSFSMYADFAPTLRRMQDRFARHIGDSYGGS